MVQILSENSSRKVIFWGWVHRNPLDTNGLEIVTLSVEGVCSNSQPHPPTFFQVYGHFCTTLQETRVYI